MLFHISYHKIEKKIVFSNFHDSMLFTKINQTRGCRKKNQAVNLDRVKCAVNKQVECHKKRPDSVYG